MRMKTFGAVVLAISAALAIPEEGTAQTSNLTKQQVHEVANGVLGSWPSDPNQQKALAQQLEAINAKATRHRRREILGEVSEPLIATVVSSRGACGCPRSQRGNR